MTTGALGGYAAYEKLNMAKGMGAGNAAQSSSAEISGEELGIQETGSVQETQPVECETCAQRTYQDGSDDPGVSFKSAAHIDPNIAGSVVRAHEQEHVVREQSSAAQEDREVVSQSVSIHTSVCPECGKVYVSGGTTKTVTRKAQETDSFTENYKKTMTANQGVFLDTTV